MQAMKFKDIPQLTADANYQVNIPWDYLETWLDKDTNDIVPDLDPPFQRAHIWTEEQYAFSATMVPGD